MQTLLSAHLRSGRLVPGENISIRIDQIISFCAAIAERYKRGILTMIKRMLCMLMILMLPLCALGEGAVVNLIEDPDATYAFAEDAPLLTVVFPRVIGSDACLMIFGDETLLVDASTLGQQDKLRTMFRVMGITRIDTGFNTHHHNDHLSGFLTVAEEMPMGRMIVVEPTNAHFLLKRVEKLMASKGIPMTQVGNGDVLTLGDATLTVLQHHRTDFTTNDDSAMLLVRFGERTLLMSADVENRAQAWFAANPPPDNGLKADILKYPHHGQVKLNNDFFALIDPELSIATSTFWNAKGGREYMTRKGVPMLYTRDAMLRLRTDGKIWVVDALDNAIE